MATQPNRTPREVVDFPANVPVTVALKYAQGRTVSTQYGERIMFSLVDGRVMFLDPAVAGQIEPLDINVAENFTVTRKWDGQKGSAISWEVARAVGEQPNGTLVVPGASPKPLASAAPSTNGAHHPAAQSLVEEVQGLVEVYAALREYTRERFGGAIKSAEVRAFVTTAYIQRGKSVA
jgi:hypothetical protein